VTALAPKSTDIVVIGNLAKLRRVVVLDEYGTSCKCSMCTTKVEHPKRWRQVGLKALRTRARRRAKKSGLDFKDALTAVESELKSEEKHGKLVERLEKHTVNGISWCPNCRKTLSRDANACANMSCCAWELATKGKRPEYLTRPQSSKQRRKQCVLSWQRRSLTG